MELPGSGFRRFCAEDIDVSHAQGEYQTINGQFPGATGQEGQTQHPKRAGDLLADPMTVDATLSIRKQRKQRFFYG